MQIKEIIQNQEQKINLTFSAIEDIQRQLDELKQSLRVDQQLAQAQKTAENELNKWVKQGEKLLKDCAAVFPIDFLDGIQENISDIAENVKDNYDDLANSDRFLNSVDDDVIQETTNNITELKAIASEVDPDYVSLVENLTESELKKIKVIADVNTRTTSRKALAKLLIDKLPITVLKQMIDTIKSQQLTLVA